MANELNQVWGHRARMLTAGASWFELDKLRDAIQDWDDWLARWTAVGERYEAEGDRQQAEGHLRTAAENWAAAAVYYQFGQFLFFEDPERKEAVSRRRWTVFRKAAPHLLPPAERVEVPCGDLRVPGYLRRPLAGSPPHPCIILTPGLEATKEELHTFPDVCLARGFATFTYDGLGQGELWERSALGADYHRGVSAIVDHLSALPDIDAGRIAIVGVSLGGLLAPMSAAHEPRLRACVSICGAFDIGAGWETAYPLMKRGYQHVTHARDEADARQRASQLTLAPVARDLKAPTLVLHAGQDAIYASAEANRFKQAVPHAEVVILEEGSHVCNNIPHVYRPLVVDWVADQLR